MTESRLRYGGPPLHRKMAEDCWRMIAALAPPKGTPMSLKEREDLNDAAIALIEMACDSAAESARMALGHPPTHLRGEPAPPRAHEWEFYVNGSFCKRCGAAIGSGAPCR